MQPAGGTHLKDGKPIPKYHTWETSIGCLVQGSPPLHSHLNIHKCSHTPRLEEKKIHCNTLPFHDTVTHFTLMGLLVVDSAFNMEPNTADLNSSSTRVQEHFWIFRGPTLLMYWGILLNWRHHSMLHKVPSIAMNCNNTWHNGKWIPLYEKIY